MFPPPRAGSHRPRSPSASFPPQAVPEGMIHTKAQCCLAMNVTALIFTTNTELALGCFYPSVFPVVAFVSCNVIRSVPFILLDLSSRDLCLGFHYFLCFLYFWSMNLLSSVFFFFLVGWFVTLESF